MINWNIFPFYSYLHIKTITKTHAESRFVICMLEDKTKIFVMNLSQEWNSTFFFLICEIFFFSFGPFQEKKKKYSSSLQEIYSFPDVLLLRSGKENCVWHFISYRTKEICYHDRPYSWSQSENVCAEEIVDHKFCAVNFFVLCIREEPPHTNSKSTYQ